MTHDTTRRALIQRIAALDTDRAAPIQLDTYRTARAERLQSIQRDRNHLRQFGD